MPRHGNSRHSTAPKPSQPTRFAVKFDGRVWHVQQGTKWRQAREVSILAPVITSSSGTLYGTGVVTKTGPDTFAVTA